MDDRLLDIFIINWSGMTHFDACMKSLSLAGRPDCRVTVIDLHGGIDAAALKKSYLGLEIARVPEKSRRPGPLNRALDMVRGNASCVAFIDSSFVAEPGWVYGMMDAALHHPDAGALVPVVLWDGDPDVVHNIGVAVGEQGRIWENLRGRRFPEALSGGRPHAAHRASVLFPRSVIDEVGRFDERFDAHYAMADYCIRAERLGYKTRAVPGARAHYLNPDDIYECMPRSSYLINQARLMLKHYPLGQALRETAGLIATILLDREGKRMAGADVADRFCRARALRGIVHSFFSAAIYRACRPRRPKGVPPFLPVVTGPPPMMQKARPASEPPPAPPARLFMGVNDESLGRGWWELRTERIGGVRAMRYRWMSKQATVRVRATGRGRAVLQIMLSPPPKTGGKNSLAVYLNGVPRGKTDVLGRGWRTLHLPLEYGGGAVEITLESERTYPSDITGLYEDVSFMVAEVSLLDKNSPFLRPSLSRESTSIGDASRILRL